MPRTIRVRDLPEHPTPGVVLYCPYCGNKSSACRGDYFMAKPETVFRCDCDGAPPMQLVRQRTILEDWRSK